LLHHVHPELLKLWRFAELIHCGKQAAFGFGAIRILPA
jgi:CRISPR/Cas system endoribonuclease Cas6 (RAMP superfamily)